MPAIIPDVRGMNMNQAVRVLTDAGFNPRPDDPIEENEHLPDTWGPEGRPKWNHIHRQYSQLAEIGEMAPLGSDVFIRVVLRMGERDYSRTKWDDFDEVQHDQDHGRGDDDEQ